MSLSPSLLCFVLWQIVQQFLFKLCQRFGDQQLVDKLGQGVEVVNLREVSGVFFVFSDRN